MVVVLTILSCHRVVLFVKIREFVMICREGASGGSAAMLENAGPGAAHQRTLHGDVTPGLPRADRTLPPLLRLQGAAPLQAHPARGQEDYSRSVSLRYIRFTTPFQPYLSETCSSVHIYSIFL